MPIRKKVLMVTKPRGGGLKALVAGPLRKELVFYYSRDKIYPTKEFFK